MVVQRRKHIRFKPDPLDIAFIQFNANKEVDFQPESAALIVEEAPMGGCCLILHGQEGKLRRGDTCTIQLGKLHPLSAEIKWREDLSGGLIKIGCAFLE